MITTERMQTIVTAVILGESLKAKNAEEGRFIARTVHDVSGIKSLGHEVSIPPEWPALDSGK